MHIPVDDPSLNFQPSETGPKRTTRPVFVCGRGTFTRWSTCSRITVDIINSSCTDNENSRNESRPAERRAHVRWHTCVYFQCLPVADCTIDRKIYDRYYRCRPFSVRWLDRLPRSAVDDRIHNIYVYMYIKYNRVWVNVVHIKNLYICISVCTHNEVARWLIADG